MKRAGFLRRHTPLVRRTRIKPVSTRRQGERLDYEQAKAAVILRDGWCQGPRHGLETPCGGPLDVHHVRPVGRYPELRCEPTNMRLLCRAHHQECHDRPKWSRTIGLLV